MMIRITISNTAPADKYTPPERSLWFLIVRNSVRKAFFSVLERAFLSKCMICVKRAITMVAAVESAGAVGRFTTATVLAFAVVGIKFSNMNAASRNAVKCFNGIDFKCESNFVGQRWASAHFKVLHLKCNKLHHSHMCHQNG